MNEQGIADRVILYDERYIKTGCEPPAYVLEALEQVYPMARLDWHPVLERWTLWEQAGCELTLIGALADENGGYVTPNLHNTIGFLDRCLVAGRIETERDMDEWLAELDEVPDDVKALEAEGNAKVHAFNDGFFDLLRGKSQVQVDK